MRSFRSGSRGFRALTALAVAGAGFAVATAVQAGIPSSNGVVHGCYQFSPPTTNRGVVRVIDAEGGEVCRYYEHPLDWNQTGPPGPTGPAGPSDTYYASGQATVGNPTVVASIAVPPGNYLVSATGWGVATCPPLLECFPGRRDVQCGIDGFHSSQDDDFFAVSTRDNLRETMAVHLDVALPNGGTVNVQCQSNIAVQVSAQLTATAVGTLHGPTFS